MIAISNYIGRRTIKTAIGAALAVLISQLLNLSYAVNSGIIVILSVQTTKKRSWELARMRLGSTILALLIGKIVFTIVGFNALAFGLYLLIFIPVAARLKFNDGIVPCSVLVSHLLAVKSVSWAWLGNEMMQMVIGAGIGIILNLRMPSREEELDKDITDIEIMFRQVFMGMVDSLKNQEYSIDDDLYKKLEFKLEDGYNRSLMEAENRRGERIPLYVRYMETKLIEFDILNNMRKHFRRIYNAYSQTVMVANLTEFIADRYSDPDTAEKLLEGLNEYKDQFKEMALPQSRNEFENRAILFEYISDLEHLLEVKKTFDDDLTKHTREA